MRPAPENTPRTPAWVPGWLIGPAFLVLAAWFVFGPAVTTVPPALSPSVAAAAIDPGPRRDLASDPPRVTLGGFERTCMDCHRLFQTSDDRPRVLQQHADLVLDHGPNVKCSTCHHWTDRDRLARIDGTPLPYSEGVALCAQCHSSRHRDWEAGVHGRATGAWDPRRPDRMRLRCTQCHDPHAPHRGAMSPVAPLPGPNTLRMGGASEHDHDAGTHDPLMGALRRFAGGTTPTHGPETRR